MWFRVCVNVGICGCAIIIEITPNIPTTIAHSNATFTIAGGLDRIRQGIALQYAQYICISNEYVIYLYYADCYGPDCKIQMYQVS